MSDEQLLVSSPKVPQNVMKWLEQQVETLVLPLHSLLI
ncbi:hypothetical protein NC653_019361 [Populus alba x Populus x berolinensis]|uniref:Uncharacterized protein n=1 Tax=Populus alba x Populus x berolinensis TaxID=444605 RepID=A0AAD6VX48_9ROSI|nr:hypothetical protein NC653_019361 [Populus alba x Populus x berolinensis]